MHQSPRQTTLFDRRIARCFSPDIIRAILDGRQPRHLNLHTMRGRQGEVPLDWEEQRGLFGFAAGGS